LSGDDTVKISQVLKRGFRGRCPQCGEGPLFVRFIKAHERCSSCGLVYQRNHGDTWLFIIITDRIPMLFGIAALYFGFQADNWAANVVFFGVLAAMIVGTIRQRVGLALALDFLSRRWFA